MSEQSGLVLKLSPVQGWGGKCQQRTPPTLSTLHACGVSLVDVVSAGVGEVKREREKQLE